MQYLYSSHKNTNNGIEVCHGEVWPHSQTHVIFFASLSSWEGHSLKGKQEFERKSWVLSAGGRLGCHGNYRVRSPGCCSTSVGTHYATSHLFISICLSLCSSVAFTCPLFHLFFPLFQLCPDGWVVGWWEQEGGVENTRGGIDWQMRRNGLTAQRLLVQASDIHPSIHLSGYEAMRTANNYKDFCTQHRHTHTNIDTSGLTLGTCSLECRAAPFILFRLTIRPQ